jgi:hypothetical protein
VQKLSKFGNFKNESPLTYKLQRGHMHIIHQITSTLRALSDVDVHFCKNSKFVDILGVNQIASTLRALFDGDVHFCENSKFIDILGVKCAEIVKIWKLQKIIIINTETSAGRTHIIHQVASTLQALSNGEAYFCENLSFLG